ncbi:hypothetical protein E2C01_073842 [Portunus trituberculatus]|uniref:Uncharacterized protein n=1 Tax=Portunus trituberculatus TaxID=210409 RepID=A0A5B7I421_PORTR|nr:hypothetical protein [Portunus trituberculatus]
MLFGNRASPGSIWKARPDWFSRVRRCSPPTDGPITARRCVSVHNFRFHFF